jgi:hypothetical protein
MKLMKSSSAAVIFFWVNCICWVKSLNVLSLASGMVTEGSIEKVPIPGRFNFLFWYRYLANKADSFKIYGFVLHKLKINWLHPKHAAVMDYFCSMTNEREKLFIEYWERRRDREGNFLFQLLSGLPVGLLFALPIMFILFSGKYWFKRADMVANSQLSPAVMVMAVVLIATFMAVLYKRHQWEMKEQQYREFKKKAGEGS